MEVYRLCTKKENQKVYDRFRAACDTFYGQKREFYIDFKKEMHDNLARKTALCEQAEALNMSDDWRRTTDQLIHLQKQWKEIGPVPRKQADVVWKRFRSACDVFFTRKAEHFSKQDAAYEENLKLKETILSELAAYTPGKDERHEARLKMFQNRWAAIGFVPVKDKDRVQEEFKELINKHFGHLDPFAEEKRGSYRRSRGHFEETRSGRDNTYNVFASWNRTLPSGKIIWIFAKSKMLIRSWKIHEKIEEARHELAGLEEKIKQIDNNE